MDYSINDYVYIGNVIKVIKSINGSFVMIGDNWYNIQDIKPVLIEECDEIRLFEIPKCAGYGKMPVYKFIEPGSIIKDALLDKKELRTENQYGIGPYWIIPEDMHNKRFFFERGIIYVHELQHYISDYSPSMSLMVNGTLS